MEGSDEALDGRNLGPQISKWTHASVMKYKLAYQGMRHHTEQRQAIPPEPS